jgi:hypothetical protein
LWVWACMTALAFNKREIWISARFNLFNLLTSIAPTFSSRGLHREHPWCFYDLNLLVPFRLIRLSCHTIWLWWIWIPSNHFSGIADKVLADLHLLNRSLVSVDIYLPWLLRFGRALRKAALWKSPLTFLNLLIRLKRISRGRIATLMQGWFVELRRTSISCDYSRRLRLIWINILIQVCGNFGSIGVKLGLVCHFCRKGSYCMGARS